MSEELNIKLTDLIDVETLQKIQDTFSGATGMAALTTEADGRPVTKGSNFTRFCMNYTRCSELGESMCIECDRFGAEETLRTGHSCTYGCHAGLNDFSAPIMAGNQMVGCFIGGQVLTEAPDEETIREIARNYDINEDEYWEAAQEIEIISQEKLENAANFLYTVAEILSKMAYGKYLTLQANEELSKAAKLQGDFLANMSHEIRTPMNAVIGFAEMALREDLPKQAREYIEQIKTSGNSLLSIINDILDFSKIESGKMEIIPAEYEPLSLIDDVANIVMTRLVDKDVELLLDLSPNIPQVLYGDNNRIRQILINLCNNATKFTHEGYVKLVVDFDWDSEEEIILHFSIQDTGIGIKAEDMEKIFSSFQQVDSKRNRNIEGSGLGLTICRNLLKLMGADLEVESEYGKGSTFSFSIKQKVVDSKASIVVENADKFYVATRCSNQDVQDDFVNDARKLGINAAVIDDDGHRQFAVEEWAKKASEDKEIFFFIDQDLFDPRILEVFDSKLNIHHVVIVETFADVKAWNKYKDLIIIRKPISVLNLGLLFNHKEIVLRSETSGDELYNFVAPDANVLVVDDNIVNLTIAQGLIEPLKMTVDTACSGREAIRMAKIKHYDMIFMDHMMPEMDGVEATHLLRREAPDYIHVPIIALTANAVADARAMFREEGLDDFVAKPIEVRTIIDVIRKYIPQEKILKGENYREAYVNKDEQKEKLVVADLDVETAVKMLGSQALFMNILKIYYQSIDSKAAAIKKLYDDKNWNEYAIEVHALKSSSRQIGATELGELAYTLEMAGKNEDIYIIERDTDKLLSDYLAYKNKLAEFCKDDKPDIPQEEKPQATKENLKKLFGRMRVAIDDLDMDEMETVLEKMDEFSYSVYWQGKYDELKNAVSNMDVEQCIVILDNWL